MEQVEFLAKLADLSGRIDARSEDFEERGEFSDVHRQTASRIRQHHDQLRVKVEEAVRQGATWDLIKAEFIRDYNRLFDDLLKFEEEIDAEAMKNRKRRTI